MNPHRARRIQSTVGELHELAQKLDSPRCHNPGALLLGMRARLMELDKYPELMGAAKIVTSAGVVP